MGKAEERKDAKGKTAGYESPSATTRNPRDRSGTGATMGRSFTFDGMGGSTYGYGATPRANSQNDATRLLNRFCEVSGQLGRFAEQMETMELSLCQRLADLNERLETWERHQ